MENTQQHLFGEAEYQVVQASGNKRFLNFVIDRILFIAFIYLLGFVIGTFTPGIVIYMDEDSLAFKLVDLLFSLVLYGLYMFSMEAVFKGKSIGKLITGTCAVNEDGTDITLKTAFLRGLSRMVPFEPFSGLGSPCYPWHDRWTKTLVIDERLSIRPKAE